MELDTVIDAGDELRAVDLPAVSTFREATPEEVARAEQKLSENLGGLAELRGVVRVDIIGGPTILVDCAAGKIVEGANSASRIVSHPNDLVRIIEGRLDPRSAMLFSVIKAGGDISLATQFCDRLSGNHSKTYMEGNPELPKPTTDMARAKSDLEKFGYCLLKDAMTPEEVKAARERLIEQAEAEAEAGVAWFEGHAGHDDGPTQRVWNLTNKGQIFLDLLKKPLIDYFMRDALGDYYIVSNYLSVIAGPGNEPQQLHTDQVGVQPQITDFSVGMNVLWFLDDVTEENGGTRVFPGSHRVDVGPDNIFVSDGTVAAAAPAGSAMIFDTRLWHGTGMNKSDKRRHVLITLFYRSWMRAQINPFTSIHPDVAATFDDELKVLFGYRCTSTHGGREDQIEGELNGYDPAALIGEMKPKSKA